GVVFIYPGGAPVLREQPLKNTHRSILLDQVATSPHLIVARIAAQQKERWDFARSGKRTPTRSAAIRAVCVFPAPPPNRDHTPLPQPRPHRGEPDCWRAAGRPAPHSQLTPPV